MNQLVDNVVLAWARDAFAWEIEHGFSRAKTFDGMLSRIVLAALERFSKEELAILAQVLPMGVASTGPSASAQRDQLSSYQRELVERFQGAISKVRSEWWKDYSDHVHKMNTEDGVQEAKSIANLAGAIIKRIASEWGFSCEKLEPAVWNLTKQKGWGEVSVQFDLGSPLRLYYVIFVFDACGMQVRRHDHYLGVLGIGPSIWSVESRNECSDRLRTASEFIHWHLSEYERILTPILAK